MIPALAAAALVHAVLVAPCFPAVVLETRALLTMLHDGVVVATDDPAIVRRRDGGNDERCECTEDDDCLLENEHDDLVSCFSGTR